METTIKALQSLKLWQILLGFGCMLMLISVTGGISGFISSLPHMEYVGLALGFLIGISAIGVRYFPPPERRKGGARPTVAISSTQMAFVAQMIEWMPFDEVASIKTDDNRQTKAELVKKIKSLRTELGTLQGIIDREVRDGVHYVKSKHDDATRIIK